MSYKDDLHFSSDGYSQTNFWLTIQRPETIYDLKHIQQRDNMAAQDIKRLESLLANVKEYRQDLARRYSELATMPYTYKLYLVREKSWTSKKVTYTVRLARVFPDGTEINERKEVFSGAERKKAVDLFSELKKARPGIEAIQDTQKKQWET